MSLQKDWLIWFNPLWTNDDDHFYIIALFSTLKQTHCAFVTCDSK